MFRIRRSLSFVSAIILLFFTFQATAAVTVSAPVISATQSDISGIAPLSSVIDSAAIVFPSGNKWLTSHFFHEGAIKHVLSTGTIEAPYADDVWVKSTCQKTGLICEDAQVSGVYAFTSFAPSVQNDVVALWFNDLYFPDENNPDEILAFVHEERVGGSGGINDRSDPNFNAEGFTRIGLAYSSNGGNDWRYLGRILSSHTDEQPFNINNASYMVKDGMFYVYYRDRGTKDANPSYNGFGIAIARASVSDVLNAARPSGTNLGDTGTNLWHKYNNGTWTEPGLGGFPSFPAHATAQPFWGLKHHVVYSTSTNKYYMVLSQMSWGAQTHVQIFDSSDGIHWHYILELANEAKYTQGVEAAGYHYCSMNSVVPQANHIVGDEFYVNCAKLSEAAFGDEPEYYALYRWKVDLDNTNVFYRKSTDYSMINQGPVWYYQFGNGNTIANMTASGNGFWHGNQQPDTIFRKRMHPGPNETPVIKWVASQAGTVKINATVRDAHPGCGDGITAQVVHYNQELFLEKIHDGDTVGKSLETEIDVSVGQAVFFMVGPDANPYCDSTFWDPSIEYLP